MDDIKRIKRLVAKINAEIDAYIEETGENLAPEIETTIIGEYSPIPKYSITDAEDGVIVESDGLEYNLTYQTDQDTGEIYFQFGQEYELKEAIAYDRRRIKKGLRIWRSENPDAEEAADNNE